MAFEFYKIAGSIAAVVSVKKNGKKFYFYTGAQSSKSEIIEKSFKFIAQIV